MATQHGDEAAFNAAVDEHALEPSHNAGHIREEHINLVRNEYADISWHVDDVTAIFEGVTVEQAREFLRGIEKQLRDRCVERGWEIIRDEGMARGFVEVEE